MPLAEASYSCSNTHDWNAAVSRQPLLEYVPHPGHRFADVPNLSLKATSYAFRDSFSRGVRARTQPFPDRTCLLARERSSVSSSA